MSKIKTILVDNLTNYNNMNQTCGKPQTRYRQTDRETLMEIGKNVDIFASINKRMFIEYNY